MSAGQAVRPSGVVTFLFTDVEGSTRRWEADADAMRAALAAHDAVLRDAIDAHGGFLFKHTGDGVCAAFASPRSAVDAAVDAQLKLKLPVRMGLATGEAELQDGDYFGTVLNRVARVLDAGHGGQILVADSTTRLVSGVELLDLGARRLRDVPAPVNVFQVQASGLRAEFPPLKVLGENPGNLRFSITSFIGRESEIGEVEAALRTHRLVTLTGVGGVGKTRLATEVAARIADEFPDGVWFFELAAVTDPAAVPDAVAAVLGITQQPGKTMSESVAATLEGRLRLLVFDNCEHVLDAAADLIEAILGHSTTVRILATSREGLGVGDEQLWPVPSLNVEAGIGSAAATLFCERAQGVSPHFTADNADEAAAVVDICRRLDGIPLAIELAASRMASMTAQEVSTRLDQRFRLLVGSRRGLQRHHTLRHAVAWSYDLLGDEEKALLDRCSVFAGGFDLESAYAVARFGGSDDYAVLDLLGALVRKSLLVADRSAGRTRFAMLETIREFAEEQLVARGEATAVRDAHARHFAAREADIMALWDSARQREAYGWFTAELANLRTAYRWAADNNDLDTAAVIATFAGFLGLWVEIFEPGSWVEELIDRARSVDHPRLAFLYVVATMCHFAGRVDDALRYLEAGASLQRDRRGEVPYGITCAFGGAYMTIGRPDRWAELCRSQLAVEPDPRGSNTASLAMALWSMKRQDEARAAADGVLVIAEAAADNPAQQSFALLGYGTAWQDAEPERALAAARRGLRIAQDSGNRAIESNLAMTLGRFEVDHGDRLAALDCLMVAIRNFRDAGNVAVMGVPLTNLAILLDRIERYEAAATILGFAFTPMAAVTIPEADATISHLREVLGAEAYDSLAAKGKAMTTAAMATYACDAIDQARMQLAS